MGYAHQHYGAKAYEKIAEIGESTPIHSLHRAYVKGQADRDLYWINRWTKKDAGKMRSVYKTAIADIKKEDVLQSMRNKGFFTEAIPTTGGGNGFALAAFFTFVGLYVIFQFVRVL